MGLFDGGGFNPLLPHASLLGGGGASNWDRVRRYRQDTFAHLSFLERLDPAYFARARQELLGSLGSLEKGYDTAAKTLTGTAASSRQAVLDQGKQTSGALTSSLTSRGLGSTTVGANLQRGVAADTSRSLAGIESGLAGGLSQLQLGKGQAQAGVQQQLAGLTLSEESSRMALGDRRLQFLQMLMGLQPQGNAGVIGQAAGTVASFLPFGQQQGQQGQSGQNSTASLLPLLLAMGIA